MCVPHSLDRSYVRASYLGNTQKEVFPVMLDLCHNDLAATLGTAYSVH